MKQEANISIGTHNINYFIVNENAHVGLGNDEASTKLHVKGNKMLVKPIGINYIVDADILR